MVRPILIFVAASEDEDAESGHVAGVAAALNRPMAAERGVQFQVLDWKTDARARVHEKGPQAPIDSPRTGCEMSFSHS